MDKHKGRSLFLWKSQDILIEKHMDANNYYISPKIFFMKEHMGTKN